MLTCCMDANRDYDLSEELSIKRRSGAMVKPKAILLLDEGMDYFYPLLSNENLPVAARLQIMTFLRDLAGMSPKAVETQAQGPRASIRIVFSGNQAAPVIDNAPDEPPEHITRLFGTSIDVDLGRDDA